MRRKIVLLVVFLMLIAGIVTLVIHGNNARFAVKTGVGRRPWRVIETRRTLKVTKSISRPTTSSDCDFIIIQIGMVRNHLFVAEFKVDNGPDTFGNPQYEDYLALEPGDIIRFTPGGLVDRIGDNSVFRDFKLAK